MSDLLVNNKGWKPKEMQSIDALKNLHKNWSAQVWFSLQIKK